ncbi:MAG TPA: TIGR00374 family protein, partial [Mycobacterium sp.]|nr:TIGR00374 family protein [Mycobacterium sp.]
MASPIPASDSSRGEGRSRRRRLLRWVVPVVAAVVVAVEVTLVRDQLSQAWHSLVSAKWWWVAAAVGAALLSVHGLA